MGKKETTVLITKKILSQRQNGSNKSQMSPNDEGIDVEAIFQRVSSLIFGSKNTIDNKDFNNAPLIQQKKQDLSCKSNKLKTKLIQKNNQKKKDMFNRVLKEFCRQKHILLKKKNPKIKIDFLCQQIAKAWIARSQIDQIRKNQSSRNQFLDRDQPTQDSSKGRQALVPLNILQDWLHE